MNVYSSLRSSVYISIVLVSVLRVAGKRFKWFDVESVRSVCGIVVSNLCTYMYFMIVHMCTKIPIHHCEIYIIHIAHDYTLTSTTRRGQIPCARCTLHGVNFVLTVQPTFRRQTSLFGFYIVRRPSRLMGKLRLINIVLLLHRMHTITKPEKRPYCVLRTMLGRI